MKRYSSKILLFGEYTLLKGSGALAVPLARYGGTWRYTDAASARERQLDLPEFAAYLANKTGTIAGFRPNVVAFRRDLAAGLYFESNIPQGYGAGSSGALCAAVYDVYFEEKTSDLLQLKAIFALMEGFFHGASSGFDPLVSYLGQAVRIHNKEVKALQNVVTNADLFLIDTGISRSTSPLVRIFLSKCALPSYEQALHKQLIPATNAAIHHYLTGNATLFEAFTQICTFQYQYFQEMIPSPYRDIWAKALTSEDFKIKLCGAGGGGFLLGITRNRIATQASIQQPLIFLKDD